eukprot:CAMPEP_0196663906 /NCGR_PEP_ID=MMETSP1086-20130531/54734_1 /TAXON_ID=77921 /ORGANISM="Cyanoptyche  gloeocystis , Strain SAG4.97" /LENGTH=60 /DNA_ID=CAMNT_0041999915 /DNA_START=14 /DNA_END=193 /DNA_ORIENTATION=-
MKHSRNSAQLYLFLDYTTDTTLQNKTALKGTEAAWQIKEKLRQQDAKRSGDDRKSWAVVS